jgi:hypothetical protein
VNNFDAYKYIIYSNEEGSTGEICDDSLTLDSQAANGFSNLSSDSLSTKIRLQRESNWELESVHDGELFEALRGIEEMIDKVDNPSLELFAKLIYYTSKQPVISRILNSELDNNPYYDTGEEILSKIDTALTSSNVGAAESQMWDYCEKALYEADDKNNHKQTRLISIIDKSNIPHEDIRVIVEERVQKQCVKKVLVLNDLKDVTVSTPNKVEPEEGTLSIFTFEPEDGDWFTEFPISSDNIILGYDISLWNSKHLETLGVNLPPEPEDSTEPPERRMRSGQNVEPADFNRPKYKLLFEDGTKKLREKQRVPVLIDDTVVQIEPSKVDIGDTVLIPKKKK